MIGLMISPSIFQDGVLAEDAPDKCAVVKTPNCKIWLVQTNFFRVWRMKNQGVMCIMPVVQPPSSGQPRPWLNGETPPNAPTPDPDKCRSCAFANTYFPVSEEMKQNETRHLHHNKCGHKSAKDPNNQSHHTFLPMQINIVWQICYKPNRRQQQRREKPGQTTDLSFHTYDEHAFRAIRLT